MMNTTSMTVMMTKTLMVMVAALRKSGLIPAMANCLSTQMVKDDSQWN